MKRQKPTKAAPTTLVDLSHVVEHGLVTYHGLPAPIISEHMTREESRKHYGANTEFQIGKIDMVANTGTYLDSPFHRFADGKDLSQLPLQVLANLEGICVAPKPGRAIGAREFNGMKLKGKAILVHTGWSRHWRTPAYFEGHPFLTADAAEFLVHSGAVLVGIDSYNIDDTADGLRPVHTALLGNGIPIVEHMTGLEQLPPRGFRFFAVPVQMKGLGSFPVRAFAMV